jgi:hypothetical protein
MNYNKFLVGFAVVISLVSLYVATREDAAVGTSYDGSIITNPFTFEANIKAQGGLNYEEVYEAVTTSNTLTVAESGLTSYLATGGTSTLPAVASSAGVVLRFVVADAITASTSVVSAEGDNIEGSMIVAGAVVDCNANDEIRFVDNLENVGDYVELRSNGTKWFVTSSNALTASSLTCSG